MEKEESQRQLVERLFGTLPKRMPSPVELKGEVSVVPDGTLRSLAKAISARHNTPVNEVLERLTKQVRGIERGYRDRGVQGVVYLDEVESGLDRYYGPEGRAVRARTASARSAQKSIEGKNKKHAKKHAEVLAGSSELSVARKARREESRARAEKAAAEQKRPA